MLVFIAMEDQVEHRMDEEDFLCLHNVCFEMTGTV